MTTELTTDAVDDLLFELAETPAFIERALARFSSTQARTAPEQGGFSLVEQIWHLADLEREGYGERIHRILGEDALELPDFDGDRIARERCYGELDVQEGLALFKSARAYNVAVLRRTTIAERSRRATQEAVGPITLADVPRMMRQHDRGHRAEIESLMRALAIGSG